MPWISSLAGKVSVYATTLIIGLAVHVPFVMKILSSEPGLFPFTKNLAVQPSSMHFSKQKAGSSTTSTATQDIKPLPIPPEGAAPVYLFMKPDLSYGIDGGPSFKNSGYDYTFQMSDDPSSTHQWLFLIQETPSEKGQLPKRKAIGSTKFDLHIESISFSPDNQYLAVETRNRISSSSVEFQLYVVNLTNGSTTQVTNYPQKTNDYGAIPYIESYAWNPNDTLNIIFYYIFPRGNDNYYRISYPTQWIYNFQTNIYTYLGKVKSTQIPEESLFSGTGILASTTLRIGTNNISGLDITLIPVYEIAPDKVLGLEGNAADNYNQLQETIWNGYTIVQNEGDINGSRSGVYDDLGNLIFQKGRFIFGMFLKHILTFEYQGDNYFILGGGDCGNEGCGWEYNVFEITNAGKIESLNKNNRSLWTNGGSIDSNASEGHTIAFAAAYNSNLYLFVDNDSGGYHVIELNPAGSIVKEIDTDGSNIETIFNN